MKQFEHDATNSSEIKYMYSLFTFMYWLLTNRCTLTAVKCCWMKC